jgi:hypothetical protein
MKIRERLLRSRNDDDRETTGVRGDFLADRKTVDVRQHDIEDDRIDSDLLVEDRHRFEAVSCLARRESSEPKGEAQQASEIAVFFNDQDGKVADRHCWTPAPSWTGRRFFRDAARMHRRRWTVPRRG